MGEDSEEETRCPWSREGMHMTETPSESAAGMRFPLDSDKHQPHSLMGAMLAAETTGILICQGLSTSQWQHSGSGVPLDRSTGPEVPRTSSNT